MVRRASPLCRSVFHRMRWGGRILFLWCRQDCCRASSPGDAAFQHWSDSTSSSFQSLHEKQPSTSAPCCNVRPRCGAGSIPAGQVAQVVLAYDMGQNGFQTVLTAAVLISTTGRPAAKVPPSHHCFNTHSFPFLISSLPFLMSGLPQQNEQMTCHVNWISACSLVLTHPTHPWISAWSLEVTHPTHPACICVSELLVMLNASASQYYLTMAHVCPTSYVLAC